MKHIYSAKQSAWLLMACGMMTFTHLQAEDLAKAEVVAANGDWKVSRTINNMTDKPSCTGLYKNRFDIQLSENKLLINMQGNGGVDGYTLRIDDDSPITEIPSRFEKELSLVGIGGETDAGKQVFARLMQGARLRVNVLTLLMTSKEYDISLNGLADAYSTIMGEKCGAVATVPPVQDKLALPPNAVIPNDVAGIIAKTDLFNDQCRDGSGDNPATMKACDSREKYTELLKKKGWCWGNDAQAGFEKSWQPCQ